MKEINIEESKLLSIGFANWLTTNYKLIDKTWLSKVHLLQVRREGLPKHMVKQYITEELYDMYVKQLKYD